MKWYWLIACLFSTQMLSAAVKLREDSVAKARSEAMELGAKLTSLEKEIGSKNNLYLSSLEQIKQFDLEIKNYRLKLEDLHQQVRKARLENSQILKSYLVKSNLDSSEAWQKKVHLELLKQAQSKLSQKENELISIENKVVEFNSKLAELKQNEEELEKVINELENRKKVTMELYLNRVKQKKHAETREEFKQIKQKISSVRKAFSPHVAIQAKADRLFLRPVDDFSTYTPSPKGVTFRFRAVQPVKAVGEGKVVFAGDLASYGQVIMVDHGNDLRSVLLGKMDIRIRKNDAVRDGQILAYTQPSTDEEQNLYFEVRKKNTAQNTILWLDLKGVSKI